jgi:hypothetical protein
MFRARHAREHDSLFAFQTGKTVLLCSRDVPSSTVLGCAGYMGYSFHKNALKMTTTPIFSYLSTSRAGFSTKLFTACFGTDIRYSQHTRQHLCCRGLAPIAYYPTPASPVLRCALEGPE